MTREEFELALDRYIVPDNRWGHADESSMCWGKNEGQECCLEQKPVRDFLFGLMTKGLAVLDDLPVMTAGTPSNILTCDEGLRDPELDMSRYAIMNREVQKLKTRTETLKPLRELYSRAVADDTLSPAYGRTEGFAYYTAKEEKHLHDLPMIVYARPNAAPAESHEVPWRNETYTVMSTLGETLDVDAAVLDDIWSLCREHREVRA
jgi:hypothetical protein